MIAYKKGSSALHFLDARIKLLWLAGFSLILVFIRIPEVALAAAIINLFLLQISEITPQTFWKEMKGLLLFAFIPVPLQLLATGSIYLGLLNSLILINLLASAFLFISTTRIRALIDALLWLRVPAQLTFSLALAFSFMPLLEDELHKARVAQAARGGSLTRPSSVLPMVIPVLHGIFLRARKLSISLDARGFNPEKTAP